MLIQTVRHHNISSSVAGVCWDGARFCFVPSLFVRVTAHLCVCVWMWMSKCVRIAEFGRPGPIQKRLYRKTPTTSPYQHRVISVRIRFCRSVPLRLLLLLVFLFTSPLFLRLLTTPTTTTPTTTSARQQAAITRDGPRAVPAHELPAGNDFFVHPK